MYINFTVVRTYKLGLTTRSINAGTLLTVYLLVAVLSLFRFCLKAVKKSNKEIGGMMMVLFALLTIITNC